MQQDHRDALIHPSEFIGLENTVHLAAGGEGPMLASSRDVVERFFSDKAKGEAGRHEEDATATRCRGKVARLFGVDAEDIGFVSNSSEGINILTYGLDWKPGENVVVCDVEFPTEVLPWTRLKDRGVEIRVVSHKEWYIDLDDILAAVDDRTRVVTISSVSYFTGQRIPIRELSDRLRGTGALLVVDATHAAGAVPVEASYADVVVASCYKWLLSTHGVAILYWNRKRLEGFKPPFLGWHSGTALPDWRNPTEVTLRPGAAMFEMGNVGFISVYLLENALDRILKIGIPKIEEHVLALSGRLWEGLHDLGFEMMTPRAPGERAGNVCFMAENIGEITESLAAQGILVWGGYGGVGRIRVSTHLYNSSEDVEKLLTELRKLR